LVKPPCGAGKRKSPLRAHIYGIFCSAAFHAQHCDGSAAAALGDSEWNPSCAMLRIGALWPAQP